MVEILKQANAIFEKAHRKDQQVLFEEIREQVDLTHDKMKLEMGGEGCGCASCLRQSVDSYNRAIDRVDIETAYLNGHEPRDIIVQRGKVVVVSRFENEAGLLNGGWLK